MMIKIEIDLSGLSPREHELYFNEEYNLNWPSDVYLCDAWYDEDKHIEVLYLDPAGEMSEPELRGRVLSEASAALNKLKMDMFEMKKCRAY